MAVLSKRHRRGCLWLLPALLAGCTAGQDSAVQDYSSRLARSLDTEFTGGGEARSYRLPRPRAMLVATASGSVDLLDMLALRGCQLQITIGKRNSSLGKLAGASQQLLLDLEFLQFAPACLRDLERRGERELARVLSAEQARKFRELPARIWNATLGGPEFRAFWRPPGALADYPDQTGPAVITALEQLDRLVAAWLAGEFAAGSMELESILEQIRGGDGGAMLLALDLQARELDAARAGIDRRRFSQPLCFRQQTNPQAKILETVVHKYFIDGVQPWLVDIDRRRRALMPTIRSLEMQLAAVAPPAYRDWQAQREAFLDNAAGASLRHVGALAPLLESCGLRPRPGPPTQS